MMVELFSEAWRFCFSCWSNNLVFYSRKVCFICNLYIGSSYKSCEVMFKISYGINRNGIRCPTAYVHSSKLLQISRLLLAKSSDERLEMHDENFKMC